MNDLHVIVYSNTNSVNYKPISRSEVFGRHNLEFNKENNTPWNVMTELYVNGLNIFKVKHIAADYVILWGFRGGLRVVNRKFILRYTTDFTKLQPLKEYIESIRVLNGDAGMQIMHSYDSGTLLSYYRLSGTTRITTSPSNNSWIKQS